LEFEIKWNFKPAFEKKDSDELVANNFVS